MNQTNALATAQRAAISSPESWNVMRDQAQVLVKSGFLPPSVKSPEAAIAIMMTGAEFGLEPMQSFRMIDIIQGKPVMKASAIAGLILKWIATQGDGYFKVVESTDTRCEIEYRRPHTDSVRRFVYTIDDAKRAGLLSKDTWQKFPQPMILARTQAGAGREGFPDVVAGLYDPDELGASIVETSGHVVATAYSPAPIGLEQRNEPVSQIAPSTPDDWELANRRIHAVLSAKGLTHEQLHNWAASKGFPSVRDVPAKELVAVAKRLEDFDDFVDIFRENYSSPDPVIDQETGEIIDVQVVTPARTDRDEVRTKLWRLAHDTFGWSKEDLEAVHLFEREMALKDTDAEGLEQTYRTIVVMSPDERDATLKAARAAIAN